MIRTDGRPTIANAPRATKRAPLELPYTDELTYGIVVEYPDALHSAPAKPKLRDRRHVYAWKPGEARENVERRHLATGKRVAYLSGPLGRERVVLYAEGRRLYIIDGSGVPADAGRIEA